jgi:hypothetical protein
MLLRFLLRVDITQIIRQALQLLFPEVLVVSDPCGGVMQGLRHEAKAVYTAVLRALH